MGRYAGWEKLSLADLSKLERARLQTQAKPSKYKNVKTVVDGITFDSKKEAARYSELKLMEKAGLIQNIGLHPSIELVAHNSSTKAGIGVGRYVADFMYWDIKRHIIVVEDVKSSATKTAVYLLKKLLVKACHDIEITEV